MPRIDAPTVGEHRAQRLELLISAAEEILAEQGLDALTAGAVANRAGLARNSLYRYFSSIDHLVELVVTRGFPQWVKAVTSAVDEESSPRDRVVAYVRANVQQAASSTHGWRSALSRQSLSDSARLRVRDMHVELNAIAQDALGNMQAEQPALLLEVIHALVDACVRRIDAGDDAEQVLAYAATAAERLLPPSH